MNEEIKKELTEIIANTLRNLVTFADDKSIDRDVIIRAAAELFSVASHIATFKYMGV